MTAIRPVLGGVLLIVALNAVGGGWYGLAGAKDVPREWLAGSPFRDYFVPSVILLAGVGGSCLAAAIGVFRRARWARPLAVAAGAILVAWIAAQVAIIGYVSWLQPAVACTGATVIILAALL